MNEQFERERILESSTSSNFSGGDLIDEELVNSPFTIKALPPLSLKAGLEEIEAHLENAFALNERLFECLRTEDAFYIPPDHGLRHPMIFYYGHTAVFYINKLVMAGALGKGIDADFEKILAIGVDENAWDQIGGTRWPRVAEVRDYRREVLSVLKRMIRASPATFASHPFEETQMTARWALLMGIEHDRVHFETSSALIRELPIEYVTRPPNFPPLHSSWKKSGTQIFSASNDSDWVHVSAGRVKLGRPEGWDTFAWDDENGSLEIEVPEFRAARGLVNNAAFHRFVEDDGYFDRRYWTDEGWDWRTRRNAVRPRFWREDRGQIFLRTLFEEIPLPLNWPVIVNFHEAQAYVEWLRRKDQTPYDIMSEAEHHRLREISVRNSERKADRSLKDWLASHVFANSNFNARLSSESPTSFPSGIHSQMPSTEADSEMEVNDVFGNVWQWCRDEFKPLPGFAPHPLYEDYSAPAFDGRHRVLVGGSFMSTGEAIAPWVRNNFRPHFFQHAGFRLVRST